MPSVTPFFDTDVDYLLTFSDNTTQTLRLRQSQLVSTFSVPVSKTIASIEVDPAQWILNGTGTITRDNTLILSNNSAARVAHLTVYPNPCHETLVLANLTSRAVAEVTDATGRVWLRQTVDPLKPQFDTRSLAAGLYHLRLTTPNGTVSLARFVRD